ncbi:hypothetical protein LDENG_00201430 [Lucifuga dentata]|nr:hypothetical protein LDENG_00201430 [Lucifuga dentata]
MFPERPWQQLGADLFTLKSNTYFLVVDYFSRYVEIAQLSPTRSTEVIVHIKSMFARHGIPDTLVTDNGPQFSGKEMQVFAKDYGFTHMMSSPKFAQSNGEAERAVQTVKNLLKKAADPYHALLAYRSTPLSNGYSLAELLIGRHLCTTLLSHPIMLQPALPDYKSVHLKEREKRGRDAQYYNKRHWMRDLPELSAGDRVWITDATTLRSQPPTKILALTYLVHGQQGTLQRNCFHLVRMPGAEDKGENEQLQQPEEQLYQPVEPVHQLAESIPTAARQPTNCRQSQVPLETLQATPTLVIMRSGREVKPVKKLDL